MLSGACAPRAPRAPPPRASRRAARVSGTERAGDPASRERDRTLDAQRIIGGPMDEAYISGALTAIADGARARVFYELLAEIVSECGLRPYLPHQSTDPVAAADLDP